MANIPVRSLSSSRQEHLDDHNAFAAFHNLIDAKGDLIVGTAGDTAGRLAAGAPDQVLTVQGDFSLAWETPALGGGGGAGWTKTVDLPLTSLTDFTAGAGSWSLETDRIRQASTSAAASRMFYGPIQPQSEAVMSCDIRVDAVLASNVSARAGLLFGAYSTDAAGGQLVSLNARTNSTALSHVDYERDAQTNYGQTLLAAPISLSVWTTLKVHKVGPTFSAYVNGAFVASYDVTADANRKLSRVALYTYAADASFKNLQYWTPVIP